MHSLQQLFYRHLSWQEKLFQWRILAPAYLQGPKAEIVCIITEKKPNISSLAASYKRLKDAGGHYPDPNWMFTLDEEIPATMKVMKVMAEKLERENKQASKEGKKPAKPQKPEQVQMHAGASTSYSIKDSPYVDHPSYLRGAIYFFGKAITSLEEKA